ncbi:MAG: UDP-N-acetylmuramoyl-tripeptide--D-alanyl-D-alanine ligase [Syntrophomonadaceae bacterium]|nr:UDP-N-acetylmuramoyl-tripeptide--D-alanyl-D-alanine ligase [Syntrophomonadaceae bacterium]
MINLNIDYLCKAVNGQLINGQEDGGFCGITTDSRSVKPGQVYFAIQGEKHDGHQFVGHAFQNGAVAAVVKREVNHDFKKPLILVDDTIRALQMLAKEYRLGFKMPLIAVTGSVGKTTTKEILAQCLESSFITLKTKGNFNNDIGLPLTLLNIEANHQIAVVELAMRAPGEIKRLAELARPTAAIITNVEPVHLETMHTLENIAQAKCEVLSVLSSKDFAVINGDNEVLIKAAQEYDCIKYTFGYDVTCDFRIMEVDVSHEDMNIKADFCGQDINIVFPLPAAKIAGNVVAAAAVCYLSGLDMKIVTKSLKNYQPSGNRLNIVKLKAGGVLINDTYNANPASMCAALETSRQLHQKGKFIAILGDMFELGDYEREGHLKVGNKAAETGVDVLITIGKSAFIIAEGAESAGMPRDRIYSFADKKTAIGLIRQVLTREDTILVKASRGMELEEIIRGVDL